MLLFEVLYWLRVYEQSGFGCLQGLQADSALGRVVNGDRKPDIIIQTSEASLVGKVKSIKGRASVEAVIAQLLGRKVRP